MRRATGGNGETAKKEAPRVGEHHGGSFGVYFAHKIQKLRQQNVDFRLSSDAPSGDGEARRSDGEDAGNGDNDVLFAGVHVFVDGYTVPSREEIRLLMLMHGGGFEHYETSRVTHIVATCLSGSKLLQLKRARRPLPVVHPDWIVKSIEQKRLLPVQPFFYSGFADPTQSSLPSSALSGESWTASARSPARTLSSPQSRLSDATAGSDKREEPGGLAVSLEATSKSSDKADSDDGSDIAELDDLDEIGLINELVAQSHPPSRNSDQRSSDSGRTNSTRDGPAKFVRHFFAKSRLHHIGSWRTTFQQKAAEFQAKYTGGRMKRESPASPHRVILHVDMDCFFVAVAVRDRPDLEGAPIAVAHSGNAGSSEISSCNYLARDKGVRAGMFMQTAKELCPALVVLPYDFSAIEKVSFQIYDIFFSHTPHVQAISCDEAFLEFDRSTNGLEKAKQLREQIFAQTRCAASVGVSFNILLAKMASKKAKPNGIFQIATPDDAKAFMLTLKIRDLPGVGRQMGHTFEVLGVEDVQQLRALSRSELLQHFGKSSSEMLYNYARGIDERPLSIEANAMRKSVSTVVNFGIRFDTWADATEFLSALSEELSSRLRSLKVRTKCLTLLIKKRQEGQPIEPIKYMGHGICDNYSKSHVLPSPTDDHQTIGAICIELLRQFRFPCEDLRGVGIQATKLVSSGPQEAASASGKLIRTWLVDSKRDGSSDTTPDTKAQEAKGEDDAEETKDDRQGDVQPAQATGYEFNGISQLDADVLNALPPNLREEVISEYRKPAVGTGVRPPIAPRSSVRAGGNSATKAPRKRSLFEASYGENAVAPLQQGESNALDDIRMSQIDSEVYHALPFAIRKEIDRYTKKRKPTAAVPRPAPPRPHSPTTSHSPQKCQQPTERLPSIESLFDNLVQIVGGYTGDPEVNDASSAFDAIYSRILVEVENRALDSALKMLRYIRRKCSAAGTASLQTASAGLLATGFNNILEQVNGDVSRHFGGALSVRAVAPL